jgi:hypothetical protein
MTDDNANLDPFADGLIYQEDLMLGWRYVAEVPAEGPANAAVANERFLRALAAVGEHVAELREDHGELVPELLRLELKLDLLLDLVGEALRGQIKLPRAVPARLCAEGVEWFGGEMPALGRVVSLDIYLRMETPRPLQFFGQVEASRPAGGVRVLFAGGANREVAGGLEKFIFRQHRRSIAHRKSGEP